VSGAAPGRVLRLAVIGWGLGDLALGRSAAGIAWLVAEAAALFALVAATVLLADTTWYLLPFLGGMAFIVAWTSQAVAAYRSAQRLEGAVPPASSGSPAATVAWLTIPLLAWGTGFWLFAADAATSGAVLDRFVTTWPAAAIRGWEPGVAERPADLTKAASAARDRLRELCAQGRLADDCGGAPDNLLRDVRVRITAESDTSATAVAEVVRFERRPSRFLGIFDATELVPVPIERVLRIKLATRPGWLGAQRWTIVNAEPG
jgi:hypothetical protein